MSGRMRRTCAHQGGAVHVGHHHVGDERWIGALPERTMLQRFFAAGGFDHVVAAHAQRPRRKAAHGFFVFDQQDRVLAGDVARGGAFGFGAGAAFSIGRWRGRKMRNVVPLPTSRIHRDEAAGLLDDAVDGGQPQAGALAHRLGGEEGIENLAEDFLGDAGAGVGTSMRT
jgi:hypothetical protein